ncbi:MAG: hypothetical protein INF43_04850 [Alphaproteobacteria bacterium]|jgi:hypothetical protein|nr:hypothetical protein [Alphaproteobacteria bacterium]
MSGQEDEIDYSALQAEAELAEAAKRVAAQPATDALVQAYLNEWELEGIYFGLPPNLNPEWRLPDDFLSPTQLALRFHKMTVKLHDGRRIQATRLLLSLKDDGEDMDKTTSPVTIVWRPKTSAA